MTTATPTRVESGDVGTDRPPATFAEASTLGPLALLEKLRAVGLARHLAMPNPPAEQLLGELALSSAVQHTWLQLQPIGVHRALVAGATVEQVAAAIGARPAAAAEIWLRWATRQAAGAKRAHHPDPLVTREQVAAVVQRHPDIWPGGAP